ncbi:hypothetical protein [Plantactinospora sonchi]|uniref:Uncharacterized protein n=1 Tax=Plantactinospora sonchi TaxID=1544735 RepID=A0ABU7RWJ6_9ACTN
MKLLQRARWVPAGVVLAAGGTLLAGCTGPGSTAGTDRAGTGPASATASPAGGGGPVLPGPSPTDADGTGDPLSVRCGHVIDLLDAPPPNRTLVADAVALQTGTLHPNPTGADEPARLFAKTGLVVRADAAVVLSIDGTGDGTASIGWGSPARPGREQRLPGCPEYTGWLAFAGGFWVDEPTCVSLTVRAGGRTERVRMRIGAPCPD